MFFLASLLGVAAAAQTWWKPQLGLSFQWQLQGAVDTSFAANVFDIDGFDNDASVIAALHAQGRIVVCYFSSQFEDWRSDAAQFLPADKGKPLDEWPGELWVDIKSPRVRAVMQERVNVAKAKLCDAIEWDNVDPHQQTTGFAFSIDDTFDYLKYLSDITHTAGMAVALKNNVESLARLAPLFDFAVNEQCFEFDECDAYATHFTALGKPVFNVEYAAGKVNCAKAASLKIVSVLKALALKALPYTLCNADSFDNSRKLWPWASTSTAGPASATAAAATSRPFVTPCTSPSGEPGECATADRCAGSLFAASAGAKGCEALPAAVQCCARGSLAPCTYRSQAGTCRKTAACAGGSAVPSSRGARGCEHLPVDEQCCVPGLSRLEDDAPDTTAASSSASHTAAAAQIALFSLVSLVL